MAFCENQWKSVIFVKTVDNDSLLPFRNHCFFLCFPLFKTVKTATGPSQTGIKKPIFTLSHKTGHFTETS